jgi:3-deoxy-D-manno-octulosonic-acid transferase
MTAAILRRTIIVRRIIFFLYQLVQIVVSPVLALYLLYRGLRDPRYFPHLPERFGFLPRTVPSTGGGGIWLHAVSVGEVLSSAGLIRRLRARRPHVSIYVSTTTLAGRATATERLRGLADAVFYAPLDYRSMVRRVLRRLRPAALVVLETEIWPNLYREARRAGAALLVVNGRISDRALPRYEKWRWFFRHVLALPATILAQSERDRERYIAAGAPAGSVAVAGNLKYGFEPAAAVAPEIAAFLDALWPEAVWIAASTMPPAEAGDPDEDDVVIGAFQELAAKHSRLLLILAPRRPDRFETAAEKLGRAGVRFVRRSRLGEGGAKLVLPGVLLLDTIGELAALFPYATAVFMGGTLARRGGHNILEPAYFGKPVALGPHMENFAAIGAEFTAAGAVVPVEESGGLAAAIHDLLQDRQRATEIGERARALARAKKGGVDQMVQAVLREAALAIPDPRRTLPARLVLTPLSWIWSALHRASLSRGFRRSRALSTRVVSVGGLSMGGVGKSPMVAHLAARFLERGVAPAILTRGYRRESRQEIVVVPRNGSASVAVTGDEAQIFVRQGVAHAGIGADRFAAGRRLERECRPDVFLLDDGFQHVRLERSHDIVLLDALDPLAGGMFPLGRRREPLEGLARATAVVITRTDPGQDVAGIEALVRRYNPRAPIFRSRLIPREWVDLETGAPAEANLAGATRVAAFCGLGAPHSFWRTLRELGFELAYSRAFPDHHRYRPFELRRIARRASEAGAEAIVTTEKDTINLGEGAAALFKPLRLYWLRVAVEIDDEEGLLETLLQEHHVS